LSWLVAQRLGREGLVSSGWLRLDWELGYLVQAKLLQEFLETFIGADVIHHGLDRETR
jgi:hypothetical protein